jgi:hypothetical protein
MDKTVFIDASYLASRMGLSAQWINAEAKAGRIPHILAGKKFLFNEELVKQVLMNRAQEAMNQREAVREATQALTVSDRELEAAAHAELYAEAKAAEDALRAPLTRREMREAAAAEQNRGLK